SDCDLVVRSTRIFGSAQDATSHCEQERVVVEDFAGFSPESVRGFAKQGQSFGADVEVESVLLGFWIFAIAGFGSACETAHHPFDLTDGLVASGGEPLAFSLGCGNAGELADSGPADASGFERLRKGGQVLESPSHAQAFFGDSRRVAEHALG